MCDCYECKIRGATSASESADALAREVKRLAIADLDEHRRTFYQDMILNSGAIEILEPEGYTEPGIRNLDLNTIQTLYEREDVYEATWRTGLLGDGHGDYHEGYEAGVAMVLRHLHELFGIMP